MEFQEGLMKFLIQKPVQNKKFCERFTETGNGKNRWKISFNGSSSSTVSKPQTKQPPKEFTCPISGSLMADPVIVSSGHSYDRTCVQACLKLGFTPPLMDGSAPDFFTVIPNLALKSTILRYCDKCCIDRPIPLDSDSAEKLVRTLMASQEEKPRPHNETEDKNAVVSEEKELINGVAEYPGVKFTHAATELNRRPTHSYSSSDESVATIGSTPPLPLATRPSCYSSSDSSEIETLNPNSTEEEEIVAKLRSSQVYEIEEAVISLRKMTRSREETRASLCTPQVLSAIRSLIISRYSSIQVNSVAALVNLSLEKVNKVKIVRSGIVPPLIDVLKGGSPDAQEHASGALFSLALDDENKTAIGVLGALPPLLHMLRSESGRTRNDSALALYHLSLVQSNRTKLVKLGSVHNLLGMVKSGHLTGRVLLILCNLAACPEGRAVMLDAGVVECLVGMLRGNDLDSEVTRESCVVALYGLSHGGLRFKGLAKDAGAVEVLKKVEITGSERAREKAKRVLEILRGRDKEEEGVDWEELLDSGLVSCNRRRLSCGMDGSGANSSEF
ncbi:hypothetical protein L1049_002172 [Liquidambar formosana]|uniref:RING-type E3 ubiquitin transferase n=1 Tax=Liquidambar formosana TaxID=63359 RepID=A0AAP0NGT6_LIQFO